MKNKKIIMLAGKGDSTKIVYNYLAHTFGISDVIIESRVPKKIFLKKRIKKFGLLKVFGQILFQLSILKYLKVTSSYRIKQIMTDYKLENCKINIDKVIEVESVNLDKTIDIIRKIKPDIIIVNGTRIISEKVLNSIDAIIINMHMGITPEYRAVHGGYWALANKDSKNCGVTIHMLDAGIDTGKIIKQELVNPTKSDNFYTLPFLQLGVGLRLLESTLNEVIEGSIKQEIIGGDKSNIWTHPTIWEYITFRFKYGIK